MNEVRQIALRFVWAMLIAILIGLPFVRVMQHFVSESSAIVGACIAVALIAQKVGKFERSPAQGHGPASEGSIHG